jgi:WD40 repeat protein
MQRYLYWKEKIQNLKSTQEQKIECLSLVLCDVHWKTLEYKGCFEGHNNLVSRMLVFGDKLYSCSRDGSIRCWNLLVCDITTTTTTTFK